LLRTVITATLGTAADVFVSSQRMQRLGPVSKAVR